MEPAEAIDKMLPADATESMQPADPSDMIEPTENADWIEPLEQYERMDLMENSDLADSYPAVATFSLDMPSPLWAAWEGFRTYNLRTAVVFLAQSTASWTGKTAQQGISRSQTRSPPLPLEGSALTDASM